MTCKDASARILQDAGEPLHYSEIARRILKRGLWRTSGTTPEQTVSATLSQDVKKAGGASVFARLGNGMYGLRCWEDGGPARPDVPPDAESAAGARRATHSFTDAAELVLKACADRQPMHYRAITDAAIEQGLVATSGKTPEATMYSVIYQEIERKAARGEQPRFILHGQGFVGLTEWMGEGLAFEVERHNRDVRTRLLEQLMEMAPEQFEGTVARLLVALGFEDVEVTSRSADGGIDVRGVLVTGEAVRTRMAVQVKRWKRNVQAPTVQQVRGSLGAHEQGLIVTTSDFSRGARDEAERSDATPVGLMDGELMVALMVEHGIGVRKNEVAILTLDDVGSEQE